MKKFFIDVCHPKYINGDGKYVASSKACGDITTLVRNSGFEYLPIWRRLNNKYLSSLEFWMRFQHLRFKLTNNDVVFIQYPMINFAVFQYCYKVLSKCKVIAIIHDLPSFRYTEQEHRRKLEINILNSFYCIIVHNDNMKALLANCGVRSNIVVLGIFDYLLSDEIHSKFSKSEIVFAGALQKSLYLNQMDKMYLRHDYNLYGAFCPILKNTNLKYQGKFLPDDISTVKGEWGLLWDGDSVDSCTGNFGEYLKIIAPHKLSLYIVANLKVIVWEKSAMAQYVLDNNIGFTISSIHEIDDKIDRFSDEELMEMSKNVERIARELRKGKMFLTALNCCLSKC